LTKHIVAQGVSAIANKISLGFKTCGMPFYWNEPKTFLTSVERYNGKTETAIEISILCIGTDAHT
jgi:hypothetical protein